MTNTIVAQLETQLEMAFNNAPIHEAAGHTAQAECDRDTAERLELAIAALTASPRPH